MAKERCGAKTRSGEPCQAWGMANGRCRMHGGKSTGRPLKNGRYSVKKEALQDKIERFRNDPDKGTLWDELALQRALLQDALERDATSTEEDRDHLFKLTEQIGKTLDRINKIMSRTALTAAEVEYLQARIADLFKQYVPADNRQKALADLRRALPSGGRDS